MNRDDHVFMRHSLKNYSNTILVPNLIAVKCKNIVFPITLYLSPHNNTFSVVRREARPSEIDQSHAESAALSVTAKATQSPG